MHTFLGSETDKNVLSKFTNFRNTVSSNIVLFRKTEIIQSDLSLLRYWRRSWISHCGYSENPCGLPLFGFSWATFPSNSTPWLWSTKRIYSFPWSSAFIWFWTFRFAPTDAVTSEWLMLHATFLFRLWGIAKGWYCSKNVTATTTVTRNFCMPIVPL